MRCVKRNLAPYYDNAMQNWGQFSDVSFLFFSACMSVQLLGQTFKYTVAIDFAKVWASEKGWKLRYEEIMEKIEKFGFFIFS